jgi:hypothetical protein
MRLAWCRGANRAQDRRVFPRALVEKHVLVFEVDVQAALEEVWNYEAKLGAKDQLS